VGARDGEVLAFQLDRRHSRNADLDRGVVLLDDFLQQGRIFGTGQIASSSPASFQMERSVAGSVMSRFSTK
jgi:hypothetical protein